MSDLPGPPSAGPPALAIIPVLPLPSFTRVELAAGIASELTSSPFDEIALDLRVWMYVAAERRGGAGPGRVINQLVEIVDDACVATDRYQGVLRSVIVSSVEAYFGFRTGEMHGPGGEEYSSESHGTAMVANRRLRIIP